MYFRNYRIRKKWLDKCLKTPVSEEPSTSNMLKTGANTFAIWTTAPLPQLLIILKVIELEKVSFSAMQNLKTVC